MRAGTGRTCMRHSMDIDEVLRRIGDLGPTQKQIFLLISLPHLWCALFFLALPYIGTDPGWRCTAPTETRNSGHIVVAVESLSDPDVKCAYYEQGACVPEFSKEYTSIVTEVRKIVKWDLICSKSYYPNLSQSGLFLGLLIGAWVFGNLSDTYGRKKINFVSLTGTILSGIGCSLSPDFYVFSVFRFLLGTFCSGFIVSGYALLLEVVTTSKRSIVGIALHLFYPVGYSVLALMAYYIREWRTLMMATVLSGVGLLATWRMTPESPRWLLVQGKEEQALSTLAWIARGNGQQMPDCKLKRSSLGQSAGHNVTVVDLLRGKVIRHRTLIVAVAWFTNCTVYHNLSLNAGNLGGGRYLSLALSGLVELPIRGICCKYIDRLGRRWTQSGLLSLAGTFCFMWSWAEWSDAHEGLKIALALLGKMSVSGSFAVLYMYSGELFPTEVRTLGLGIASVASRTGGILSPFILLMPTSHAMVVLSALGLAAGFLTLSLPETLGQPLPETLADLEQRTITV